jgi:hypothetical protein
MPWDTSRPFDARFDSDCGGGDDIYEGDTIVMWEGVAWHETCAQAEGAETPDD